jgi:ribosomal protein S25
MNNGTHKYNKITKEQILHLFEEKDIITKQDVCDTYGCSIYLTRQLLEELKDDGTIQTTKYGYKEIN